MINREIIISKLVAFTILDFKELCHDSIKNLAIHPLNLRHVAFSGVFAVEWRCFQYRSEN